MTMLSRPIHGGPDAQGIPLHDFSSNANACGPCPSALAAVRAADAMRYPDPRYTALRTALADFHRVVPARVVLAASASEFIWRITAWAGRRGACSVWAPPHSYGDYSDAALGLGLHLVPAVDAAQLAWACDPSSPFGADDRDLAGFMQSPAVKVLDRAYEPLRLCGSLALHARQLDDVWQLWTPNKALGLTGVRGAYAIAPVDDESAVAELDAVCPSWPIGAHGVALLHAWCDPEAQRWLANSLAMLRDWKARQVAVCQGLGWTVLPGQANFFVCHHGLRVGPAMTASGLVANTARTVPRVDPVVITERLDHLRSHGIKLRDCASFGLLGHVRLSVQPPASQDALERAWNTWSGPP